MVFITNLFKLTRPQQWLKNLFIFLPLFFDRQIASWEVFYPALISFWAFCFASSSIYSLNDILDAESDKLHPIKCKRPIASGATSVLNGYGLMIILALVSVTLILFLPKEIRWNVLITIGLYYLMNLAYCIILKNIAIVDIFIISLGFVFRVIVGGQATGIWISQWIVLMTFLLALFLALSKRRDDVLIYSSTGVKMRENIVRYNLDFLNLSISIIASVTMVCYIMYTVSDGVIHRMGTKYLYITSIFVLAGILRYLQLTIVDNKSGSPTSVLMKDRLIHLCILGWIVSFLFILYL
jgi:decaprenyl-phosphate phosphoribosyltransferase